MNNLIENKIESNVAYYKLHFPTIFGKAKNDIIFSEEGMPYIDFFSAAGSINYGHNNDYIKNEIVKYLQDDYIVQGLDLDTNAKLSFFNCLNNYISKSHKFNYKIQLCGSTGANAIETALRLAHKITGRVGVFSLSGGFHGMTSGALSISSQKKANSDYIVNSKSVTFIPISIVGNPTFDPITFLTFILENEYSGVTAPAAFILETIQSEGGVNIIPIDLIKHIEYMCHKHGIILICDDIQVGCHRTGDFFSFENMGIYPDMVVLSKSISGYGIPMSLLLLKPEHDIWNPGEHNGTFRGNQLAFVGAKAALEFATKVNLIEQVRFLSAKVQAKLSAIEKEFNGKIRARGKGLIWGIDLNPFNIKGLGISCSQNCFKNGLIIECCGIGNNVLKILPPLTITEEHLLAGINIIYKAIKEETDKLNAI